MEIVHIQRNQEVGPRMDFIHCFVLLDLIEPGKQQLKLWLQMRNHNKTLIKHVAKQKHNSNQSKNQEGSFFSNEFHISIIDCYMMAMQNEYFLHLEKAFENLCA